MCRRDQPHRHQPGVSHQCHDYRQACRLQQERQRAEQARQKQRDQEDQLIRAMLLNLARSGATVWEQRPQTVGQRSSTVDLSQGQLLDRKQAGELLGQSVSSVTWWRWRRVGLADGRKLASVQVGGKTYVTREALEQFAVGINGNSPVLRSPARRRREIEAAERQLKEMGI